MKKITSIGASLALAAASLVGFSAPAKATSFEGRYYAATNNGTGTESLYEFDPITNTLGSSAIVSFPATNEITSLEVDGTNGIAYMATYGWSNSVTTQFWTVDLATATATLVNADTSSVPGVNDANYQDFALDPITGVLYARSETGNKLYTVDKATGQVISSVTIPGNGDLTGGAGIAISSTQEILISGTTLGVSPNTYHKLATVNPQTPSSMTIGRATFNPGTTLSTGLQSMDYAPDGTLVVWAGQSSTPARVGRISPSSLATLDHVGVSNVSSTANTALATTSNVLNPGLGYSIAVANVAPAIQRTISYDANLGAGSQAATVGAGSVTVSNGASLSRAGYTLAGWNTAANGSGTSVALSGSYAVTANVTLYAQWTLTPVATGYTGPLFNPIEGRAINATTGGKVVLTGRNLAKVTKVSIAGKACEIKTDAEGRIEVTLPAGQPGQGNLEVSFGGSSLVWENAFTYFDPTKVRPAWVAPKAVKVKRKK